MKNEEMKRNFIDSVFVDLFYSDKDNLLSLYNALFGHNYDTTAIEKVHLEDIFFMI